MDVILMEKVEGLGDLGDRVTVKSGYARNFLLPSGKVKLATAQNVADFEAMRAEFERQAAEVLATAEARRAEIEAIGAVTLPSKAGAEGRLFGSIGPRQIADAITAAGIEVARKEVRMPEGNIRVVGEYEVGLHLHTDVDVNVILRVEAEE